MPQHSETRYVPYGADQMFDLVADVARYPEFLPWTAAARIRSRDINDEGQEVLMADLVISFKLFRERFGSRVTLAQDRNHIATQYLDGPFTHMVSNWRFTSVDAGCELCFDVDFGFKNKILQVAAEVFFMEAMRQVVKAFETRAQALYGGQS